MNDRDAMIEAVAVALSMADPDGRALPEGAPMNRFYRMLANTALEAAEPFMQAREQAAREDERAKVVEWLRAFGAVLTEAPSWLNQQQGQALLERADAIQRNQHRNPTP